MKAFHRILTGEGGDADIVHEWTISQVSQEFNVSLSKAEDMILDDETGRVLRIMHMRAYAAAYRRHESVDGDVSKLNKSPLMDDVIRNAVEIQLEP